MHIDTQKNLQEKLGVDARIIIIIWILKKDGFVTNIIYFQVP
jgi:hypothetical protein